MATTADLNIVQGGTYSARVAVTDSTGGAINLSGYTTRGHVKHRYGDTGKLIDLDPDVVSGSGTANETVQYFDENHSFKVVR